MNEVNRMNGAGAKLGQSGSSAPPVKELKALGRPFNPLCAFYLARAVPGNGAGLAAGSVHHVVGINFMAEMLELCDPETQEPPVYVATFEDVEIVGRQDNPDYPKPLILPG